MKYFILYFIIYTLRVVYYLKFMKSYKSKIILFML